MTQSVKRPRRHASRLLVLTDREISPAHTGVMRVWKLEAFRDEDPHHSQWGYALAGPPEIHTVSLTIPSRMITSRLGSLHGKIGAEGYSGRETTMLARLHMAGVPRRACRTMRARSKTAKVSIPSAMGDFSKNNASPPEAV